MRKPTYYLLALILILCYSFTRTTNSDKALAKVDFREGYYIFSDSKPMADYDYIKTISASSFLGAGDSQYIGVRNRLIKEAKKECPNANGLILSLISGKKDEQTVSHLSSSSSSTYRDIRFHKRVLLSKTLLS
jgi:hypothetical protein